MTDSCPLNDLDLDLVTESDHLNNYCYCSSCTCGGHICPRQVTKKYPKSIFTSSYKTKFRRYDFSPRPILSASPMKKNLFRLETETTSGHDFQHVTEDYNISGSPQSTPQDKNLFKMTASSTYKQDFLNWRAPRNEIVKQNSVPLNPAVKFNAISTYSKEFVVSPLRPTKDSKPKGNTNILCAGYTKIPESTMRASFIKVDKIPCEPVFRQDNSMNLPALPGQYQTITSSNFKVKNLAQVIRRCKKQIINT